MGDSSAQTRFRSRGTGQPHGARRAENLFVGLLPPQSAEHFHGSLDATDAQIRTCRSTSSWRNASMLRIAKSKKTSRQTRADGLRQAKSKPYNRSSRPAELNSPIEKLSARVKAASRFSNVDIGTQSASFSREWQGIKIDVPQHNQPHSFALTAQ